MGVAIRRNDGTALSLFLLDDRMEGHNKRPTLSDNGPGSLLCFWESNGVISNLDRFLSNFLQGHPESVFVEMPIDHIRSPKGFEFLLVIEACSCDNGREPR